MSMGDVCGSINNSLNQKIAMCSSMIGYCHYLEAAGGEINLPLDGISDIRRVRGLVEKRLNEYSGGVGPVSS